MRSKVNFIFDYVYYSSCSLHLDIMGLTLSQIWARFVFLSLGKINGLFPFIWNLDGFFFSFLDSRMEIGTMWAADMRDLVLLNFDENGNNVIGISSTVPLF